MKKQFILLILTVLSVLTNSQTYAKDNTFKKGDRVCFVGNSITNNGEFHHNLFLYYLTRFPQQEMSFFNCGISGDVTGGILNRMDDDILVHKPTCIVLMIGMNDVRRSYYGANPTQNKDTLALRAAAISTYKTNLEQIIKQILDKKIRLVLERPTIFDQTSTMATPNNLGVNDALKICAEFVSEMGEKYKVPVVDYWTILSEINAQLQAKNPVSTIIGSDRVHPGSNGHLIMTYQLMKLQNLPQLVSSIQIDAQTEKSKGSQNCMVNNITKTEKSIQFTAKENALPFPTVVNQAFGLKLVPFNETFNKQLIQVKALQLPNYKLYIDNILIGSYSNVQLSEGIDIAGVTKTPQFVQAMKVRDALNEMWKKESLLRSIKFVEYCNDLKDCPDKKNVETVVNYLKPLYDKKNSSFYSLQLKNYTENKNNEAQLQSQFEECRVKAYVAAQPTEHTYRITAE